MVLTELFNRIVKQKMKALFKTDMNHLEHDHTVCTLPWNKTSTDCGVMSEVFTSLLETLLHIVLAVFTIDCLPSSSDNRNTSI